MTCCDETNQLLNDALVALNNIGAVATGPSGANGTSGADGDTPELKGERLTNGLEVRWKYTSEPETPGIWRLAGVVNDGADGADGAAGASGADGDTPELKGERVSGGLEIRWKYTSEPETPGIWRLAGVVNDGADGAAGATGPAGAAYPTAPSLTGLSQLQKCNGTGWLTEYMLDFLYDLVGNLSQGTNGTSNSYPFLRYAWQNPRFGHLVSLDVLHTLWTSALSMNTTALQIEIASPPFRFNVGQALYTASYNTFNASAITNWISAMPNTNAGVLMGILVGALPFSALARVYWSGSRGQDACAYTYTTLIQRLGGYGTSGLVAFTHSNAITSYDSGNDRYNSGTRPSNSSVQSCAVKLTLPSSTVTRVKFIVDFVGTNTGVVAGARATIGWSKGEAGSTGEITTGELIKRDLPTANSTSYEFLWTGSTTTTNSAIQLLAEAYGTVASGAYARIKSIEVDYS